MDNAIDGLEDNEIESGCKALIKKDGLHRLF
jgi:hypothetical protein